MKKLRIPAAFAQSAVILATAFSSMAMAQNLAIVNGKPVPSSRMQAMERQLAATGQTVDDTIRTQLKQEIINREVLLQAAEAVKGRWPPSQRCRQCHPTAVHSQQTPRMRSRAP